MRDGRPALLAFDFHKGEKLPRFGVEIDGETSHAVRFQRRFQFRPDRIVAALMLGFAAGIEGHDVGFADHRQGSIWIAVIFTALDRRATNPKL